jgi:acyl-[acyl-carrier-protein]-phospholipid O-acyltransferase/long-chain-fatty-acid--[acyl-carrier-protein] ligase
MQKSAREIIDQLQLAGLPNLWIPGSNCFFEVTQIPLLGTGKLDLRAIKETALSLCEVK